MFELLNTLLRQSTMLIIQICVVFLIEYTQSKSCDHQCPMSFGLASCELQMLCKEEG